MPPKYKIGEIAVSRPTVATLFALKIVAFQRFRPPPLATVGTHHDEIWLI